MVEGGFQFEACLLPLEAIFLYFSLFSPYMTFGMDGGEGGPQKADERGKNQLICVSDKGEGIKKSEICMDVINGSPLTQHGFPCSMQPRTGRVVLCGARALDFTHRYRSCSV